MSSILVSLATVMILKTRKAATENLSDMHLTLNDWSQGKQLIIFPENRKTLDSRKTKLTGFARVQSLSDLSYSTTKTKNERSSQ